MRPSWLAINAWTRSGLCEDWVEREGACSSPELGIDDDLRLMDSLFRTAWAMLGREGEENMEFEGMSGFKASNDDDDGPAVATLAPGAVGWGASWIDSKKRGHCQIFTRFRWLFGSIGARAIFRN